MLTHFWLTDQRGYDLDTLSPRRLDWVTINNGGNQQVIVAVTLYSRIREKLGSNLSR
jgi:hypothetical protein